MRCDTTPACEWLSMQADASIMIVNILAQVRGAEKPSLPQHLMVARGGRTKRGGRSLATRKSSWELRLAEAADYLLRAALGVQPRPHWGPLWLLPASRAELENYLTAVAGSSPEGDVESEISED